MIIIDFDNEFRHYVEEWIKNNSNESGKEQDYETEAIDVYSKWLKTPAAWIDGMCPIEYFNQFDKPHELVEMLTVYLKKGIGIPDLLLDRITEFGQDAKEELTKLFRLEYEITKGDEDEAMMVAINLLAEIDDAFLYNEYIELLAKDDLSEDIATLLIERLEYADIAIVDRIFENVDDNSSELVHGRFADVLVHFKDEKRIFDFLVNMFDKASKNISLMASYLGKYSDDRAIGILQEALNWHGINYLEYMEIKNAIEQLGKEVNHSRSFDGDMYYESLKNMQDNNEVDE